MQIKSLKEIAAHEVIAIKEVVDSVFLNGSSSGGFTMNSAIKIIRSHSTSTIESAKDWLNIRLRFLKELG